MPVGTSGHLPGRTTSYASVVSGPSTAYGQQSARPGSVSHMLNPPYEHAYEGQQGASWRESRTGSNSQNGRHSSWGTGGQLPKYSSAYRYIVADGEGYDSHGDRFFVPSYLRDSTYIRQLQESRRAKSQTAAEVPRRNSLTTSSSSSSLRNKNPHSHHGMTYDLIEKAPPPSIETVAPLPSKWNTNDKYSGLEILADGLEVKYSGGRASEREHEAYSVRADHPMPTQCGIYYFEVTILSKKREDSSIGVGFSSKDVPLSRPPGWEPESWAYHGDDGHSFCGQSSGKRYGPSFTYDDTIGCGVNFRTGTVFFTKNGDNLGPAFREVQGQLFPSVGMRRSGEHIRVNFGQSPFIFDIDSLMELERSQVRMEVRNTSTAKLFPPLDETSLVQTLVLQYLSHGGFIDTAHAFASEVQQERDALQVDPLSTVPVSNFANVKTDEDAARRQNIRAAILEGDIDRALAYTQEFYPNVLKENELIYFSLRSRKFVEMMRRAAELRERTNNTKSIPSKPVKNGYSSSTNYGGLYDEIANSMDLDSPSRNGFDHNVVNASNAPSSYSSYDLLLKDTIDYGRDLQSEFQNDPRKEIARSLGEIFSLLAYEDPLHEKQVSHLLDTSGRADVAEELNSAILISLGRPSSAALERLIQQTTALLDELREGQAKEALFLNIDQYMTPNDGDGDD